MGLLMFQNEIAVSVDNVSKAYRLWTTPHDRLVYPLKSLLKFISCSNLWKKNTGNVLPYTEFFALRDISLKIRKGESWGFIGVNGSGKSTLLKIISGNLRPSSGRVEINGKVAILDYGSGFNGDFTGKENIYIKATLLGLTRRQIKERFHSIVEFAELGEFINQPVKTYSSGMIARLGFAVVIHVDADILITDEALAVGDIFFVQKCMKMINTYLQNGTFLFVSHSINDVVSLCQNAVWLEHGIIKAIGPAEQVAQAYLNKNNIITGNVMPGKLEQHEIVDEENKLDSKPIVILGSTVTQKRDPTLNTIIDSRLEHSSDAQNFVTLIEADITEEPGRANIVKISFCDELSRPLSQIKGGELVALEIDVIAKDNLDSPIIGFQIFDRLGQVLVASDTYIKTCREPLKIKQGDIFSARFMYEMPLFPQGDYVIKAIVLMPSQQGKFVRLHSLSDALAIHCVTFGARHGLVGIPMISIKLKVPNALV